MTPETGKAIYQAFYQLADAAAALAIVLVSAFEQERVPVSAETLPAPEPENGNGTPSLLTIQEVAEQLKISEDTAQRLTKRGEIPAVRLGRAVRVRPEDLEQYIKAQVS